MTPFAERLTREMARMGWNRAELAARSGVSVHTIDGWLGPGGHYPSETSLARVADALGVPAALLGTPATRPPVVLGARSDVMRLLDQGASPYEVAVATGVSQKAVERWARQREAAPRPVTPAPKEPVAEWRRALLYAPSYRVPWCPVCGSPGPLEDHHVVYRSQGGAKGPTVRLCKACHMACHAHVLHLRFVRAPAVSSSLAYGVGGHWEWLRTEEAAKDFDALGMDGWKRLGRRQG